MNYYIGIDPGATGGIAVVNEHGDHLHSSQFENWIKAANVLTTYLGALIALEQVSAMPGQGVTSMFTFGKNYGGWIALLEYLKVPYIDVRPLRWQRSLLGTFPKGESKSRAFSYVTKRYPECSIKKTHTGIIDALCLALYVKDNH